jgi:hypothetical protein
MYVAGRFLFFGLFLFFLWVNVSIAQTISVGSLQDEQIQLNLLLRDSLNVGAINRPATIDFYRNVINGDQTESKWWRRSLYRSETEIYPSVFIGTSPIRLQNSINSRLPYGDNNGAAWYGRGHTSEFTGGIYLKSDYVSLNLQPHFIYQQNEDFLTPRFIPRDANGNILYRAEGIGFLIDAPFRFGPDSYTTIDAGHSSLRVHYGKFETGISTEPLWWGPMKRYPLILSNNAAGMTHMFAGTRKPVHIPWFGNIQAKWIGGYPKESDYFSGAEAGRTRFVNMLNVTYNHHRFPNLTLGLIRTSYIYQIGGFKPSQVIDFFNIFKSSNTANLQGLDAQDQLASAYIHILFPEARAEIFAEFAREDFSYNTRDFFNEPGHNSAYAFGFQKLSNAPFVDFVKTHLEFTNLTTSQLEQVRPQTYFYTNSRLRHGNTNNGQIIGAAIGPGSNSQFFAMDAYKNNIKAGFFAHRVVNNDNFHFQRGSRSLAPPRNFGDYFRHRVDLSFGLNFLYGPGPFYINGRMAWTKAYNYGRFDYGEFAGVTIQNYERNDRTNVHLQIGITYVL